MPRPNGWNAELLIIQQYHLINADYKTALINNKQYCLLNSTIFENREISENSLYRLVLDQTGIFEEFVSLLTTKIIIPFSNLKKNLSQKISSIVY